jgi:hypothetical protein
MKSKQIKKIIFLSILVMGVVVIPLVNAYAHQQGGTHSLVNASMKDIEDAALKYTRSRFQALSKEVTIPLARYVTDQELPSLGISKMDFLGEDPPMALVVLKGEFDVRNLRHINPENKPWRVRYIVYIFDLRAGMPCRVMVSPDGAGFRTLLNDPSLPEGNIFGENPFLEPEPGVASPEPVVAPDEKLPYGAMVPPAPTPSGAPPPTEP